MMKNMPLRSLKKRAFNLIESAITLGVVAIILGGLWAAITTINENMKVAQATEGLIVASNALRTQITQSSAQPDVNGWTDLTNYCKTMKTFPSSSFPIQNGKIQNPFGSVLGSGYGSKTGYGVTCSIRNSGADLYIATTIVVPTIGICQKMLAQVTARFKDNSDLALLWVMGDNNSYIFRTIFPISPSGTDCTGRVEPVQLRFFWTFNNK